MDGIHHELTGTIIGAGIEVHRALGPGLLENAYRVCLVHELRLRGCSVKTEVPVDVVYKGLRVAAAFRMDVMVDDAVVVELKAIERIKAVHQAQVLSYMRLTGKRIGLLMNFHTPTLTSGIKRLAL